MGTLEEPYWEMGFYSTERGRKVGIAYLWKLLGEQCPIYKFELSLGEIVKRSVIVPFIPRDRSGELKKVVKVEKGHMKSERPKWRDN